MASEFAEMLAALVGGVPGAVGAVFIDWEGEAVDQFGHIPEMDIKLIGAHWGVVLNLIKNMLSPQLLGNAHQIILSSDKADIIVQVVDKDYCIVLAMKESSHLGMALHQLERTSVEICTHM
ncbi:MAG: hypothetical protein J7M25_01170 [Deltaproteobacteria bacterium]|nr:hypothetical protein [Deltaproteobacteria bacterium]